MPGLPLDWRDLEAVLHLAGPRAGMRILGWGAGCAVVLALLWFHPASPIAMWRGDVAMGNGRPHAAVRAYDAVGRGHPSAVVRGEALRRSALVWAVELDRPDEARARYELLLPLLAEADSRAVSLDALGELLVEEGRYTDAAQRLREAHDLDPTAVEAGGRLVRSAQAAMMAGELSVAEHTWKRLAQRHPVHAARAHLGRGNLRLVRGDAVGALALFEQALDLSFDPAITATAQLGIATCLARLGDLDGARRPLGAADLPLDIQAQRESSLRAREQLAR